MAARALSVVAFRAGFGDNWATNRRLTLQSLLATGLGSLLPVIGAFLASRAINLLADPRGHHLPVILAPVAGSAVITGVGAMIGYASNYWSSALQRLVRVRREDALYRAVAQRTTLDDLEDPVFLNQLQLAQVSAESGLAGVSGFFITAIRSAVTLISFASILIARWWPSVVLIGVVATGAIFAQHKVAGTGSKTYDSVATSLRKYLYFRGIVTTPALAREMKLFGAAGRFCDVMLRHLSAASMHERKAEQLVTRTEIGFSVLNTLFNGVALCLVGLSVYNGVLTIGDFALFSAALISCQSAASTLVSGYGQARLALLMYQAYERCARVSPHTAKDRDGTCLPSSSRAPSIEFIDVWFKYPSSTDWALRDLSMRAPGGATTAIVGLNGSGKTTVMKLICRLYTPTQGVIKIDGRDIAEIPVDVYRNYLTAVFQDFARFDFSVIENLTLLELETNPSMDSHRAISVLDKAGVWGRVSQLPDRERTALGQALAASTGHQIGSLSGGEWQRVALARAIWRTGATVAIFDELNSHLDPVAEAALISDMRANFSDTTNIFITHEMSLVRQLADVVIVLQDGKLSQVGTHEQLAADDGGLYAKLSAPQKTDA